MTEQEQAPLLTIKDRINYPYILGVKLLTIDEAIKAAKSGEVSIREIEEAIESLQHSIPESFKDDSFKEDIEKAKRVIQIDNRPRWRGRRLSLETCKEKGIEPYSEGTRYEPFMVLQAVINLLQRRSMLSQKLFTEIMTGEWLGQSEIEEL